MIDTELDLKDIETIEAIEDKISNADYREDARWTVYVHIVPKELSGYDHDKYYVGITKQKVENRWGNGIHYKKSTIFYEAIQKYGFSNMQHDIIAENLTKDEAYAFEETLIKTLKSNDTQYGYNMTAGRGHLNMFNVPNIVDYTPVERKKEINKPSYKTENSLFFIKQNDSNYENMEIWKPVVNYEGLFEVSNFGRVRSLDRYVKHGRWNNNGSLALKKGKILSERDNGHGYKAVHLTVNRITKDKYVHRLVAEAFIPNPDNLPEVNHKDENSSNNCLDNLEWCTSKYNSNYGNHLEKISKPVTMYDLNMKYVDEFISAAEAERITGIHGISAVCNGRRLSAGGYIWKYKNEDKEE